MFYLKDIFQKIIYDSINERFHSINKYSTNLVRGFIFPNPIFHTSSQRIVKYIIKLTKSSAGEILCNFNKSRKQKCDQEYSKKFLKLKMPADENGVRIAELDELSYRKNLWDHTPLTDFWGYGKGISSHLERLGIHNMGEICLLSEQNEELLYREF